MLISAYNIKKTLEIELNDLKELNPFKSYFLYQVFSMDRLSKNILRGLNIINKISYKITDNGRDEVIKMTSEKRRDFTIDKKYHQ
jgi:hypothetical protein